MLAPVRTGSRVHRRWPTHSLSWRTASVEFSSNGLALGTLLVCVLPEWFSATVKSCVRRCRDQAAALAWMPSWNRTPATTSPSSWLAFSFLQWRWAACASLNTIARHVSRLLLKNYAAGLSIEAPAQPCSGTQNNPGAPSSCTKETGSTRRGAHFWGLQAFVWATLPRSAARAPSAGRRQRKGRPSFGRLRSGSIAFAASCGRLTARRRPRMRRTPAAAMRRRRRALFLLFRRIAQRSADGGAIRVPCVRPRPPGRRADGA